MTSNWLLAAPFGQLCMGVHVLHRPGFRVDVLRLAVRVGELAMGIRYEDGNGFRVTVHHRFFARTIPDAQYTDSIILELNLVMLGINFHGVIDGRLGYPCSCHIPLLRFDEMGKSLV